MKAEQLKANQLRQSCDGAIFKDVFSEENDGFNEIIGQERAVEAIEFGMDIDRDGYNIFVLGPSGSGRTSIIRRFVEEKSSNKPVPDDWCYVNNFQDHRKPRCIRFPVGQGKAFRSDMESLVSDVQRDITRALEEESYNKEKQSIAEQFQQGQNQRLMDFKKKAEEKGFTLQRTPTGIVVIPVREGDPMSAEQYSSLPPEERQAQFGTLVTNYQMIKPGALHKANGGYLIIEALHLLRQPFAYQPLKQALKEKQVRIKEASELFTPITSAGLEPEPIPLDIKVIIIGSPRYYYLLFSLDEEFRELFNVKADFNTFMERNEENIRLYARFLHAHCQHEKWLPFDNSGICRMVEYGSELVGDQTRLSTRFADICNLAREADFWARRDTNGSILRSHVQQAIDTRKHRNNRIEEVIQEMISRGDIFIDVSGSRPGQVNGLSIVSLGDYTFGRPSRITARTYVGKDGVINIDREVEMAGPIHNKGVLILAGYLNGKYGEDKPISLSASVVFEQQYQGVEGDSASSAELYALLSSLSGLPLNQNMAVTGSVNQHGYIQPIGGATKKVEGFYDACKATGGLDGSQGVLIPKTNVKNLMLRQEVVDAVEQDIFHIYPVETIDQGITILTGREAGERQEDGTYPEGTVNYLVDSRLSEFARAWTKFRSGAPT